MLIENKVLITSKTATSVISYIKQVTYLNMAELVSFLCASAGHR